MPEPRGPGIGGGVAHSGGQGAAGAGTGAGFSRQPGLAATRVRLATVAAMYTGTWFRCAGSSGTDACRAGPAAPASAAPPPWRCWSWQGSRTVPIELPAGEVAPSFRTPRSPRPGHTPGKLRRRTEGLATGAFEWWVRFECPQPLCRCYTTIFSRSFTSQGAALPPARQEQRSHNKPDCAAPPLPVRQCPLSPGAQWHAGRS